MPLPSPIIETSRPILQSDLEASLDDVLGATARQTISELPTTSAYRMVQLSVAQSGSYLPPGIPNVRLDSDSARAQIKDAGLEGRLTVGEYGISRAALDILIDRKREEVKRQEVLSRAPSGFGAGAAQLGTAFAASLLDPINVGLAFVPVVGEARYTSYLKQAGGLIGRTGVRAAVGAVEGAAGAAIAEPLVYTAKTQEQADYDFQDSLLNVGFGTVFGGGLHAGFGAFGDALSKLSTREREPLLRTAVGQAMQGRQVDIEAIEPDGLRSKIPRGEGLSDADRAIERAYAERIEQDIDGAILEYSSLKDADGGRVLNTDTARELSPEYRADRTRSAAVHEPASYLVKEIYARKLKEAPGPGQRDAVLFTGGGTGAGKSSSLSLLDSTDYQVIYDTNLNGLKSSVAKIEAALAAGKEVDIVYTYRDPVDALKNGALPRAMRMGRTVPLEEHANTHVGGAKTIKELVEKYAGDDRVKIKIVDNSKGKGNALVVDVDAVPDLEYDRVLGDLYDALQYERQAGRISDAVYRGTAGLEPRATGETGAGGQGADNRAAALRQPQQERARRQVEKARAAAERQASPESDITADVRAASAADQQLAESPLASATDEIAQQEQLLAEELAEVQEAAKIAGIDITDDLADADELISKADLYAKAARAATICGLNH